jgi:hypothetical protein
VRPYLAGLSEAQWIAAVTVVACALVTTSWPYMLVALALVVAAAARVLRKPSLSGALRTLRHVDELDRAQRSLATQHEPAPIMTSAGLRVSVRRLPGGPLDVLWSHASLRENDVRALVRDLALDGEVLPASTAGMYHVLVARS